MLAGCEGWQSAWDVHGESAISLKQLIILIVSVCSVVWALVMIALIFALVRRRATAEPPVEVDAGTERRMTITVAIAVAVTVVIVAIFTALGLLSGEHLLWWMIAGLALAVVLGAGWPPATGRSNQACS